MTLSVFTADDRRKLQHHLNLPIQDLREGSRLWQSLVYIEQLDETEGTSVATDIQTRLSKLDELESVDGSEGDFIEAIQSSSSQAQSIRVDNQFSETYGRPNSRSGYTGQAASLESYKAQLISSIRRDLGMSQQTGNNSLNTVWPGGRVEPTRIAFHGNRWGLY